MFIREVIEPQYPNITVDELATPSLVPLIEDDSAELIKEDLSRYFDNIKVPFDAVVLGCTHYAIIKTLVKEIIGNKKIISSSDGIIDDVDKYLTDNNLKGTKKRIQFFTTGCVEDFVSSSASFF
ncbi:MAG: hypothetical protein PHT75_02730 [Bacilli bacterium]|nr:hypothetical protein [Bacilli bacterium]